MFNFLKFKPQNVKSKASSENSNLELDIYILTSYVLKKLGNSKEAKLLSREIHQFNNLKSGEKLQQFPHIYFRIEEYFIAHDTQSKSTEASRLRHLIESRLTRIRNHSELRVLFLPQHAQEQLFCRNLLKDVMEDAFAGDFHGNQNLKAIAEKLSSISNDNASADSFYSKESMSKNAQFIFESAAETFGIENSIKVFLSVYKRYFEKYSLLDTFTTTVGILPDEVYEAAFSDFSKHKHLNSFFQKHIRKLERENAMLRKQVKKQTELKESHMESAELRSTILHNTFDAYFLLDRDVKIKDWNKQAEKLFGWNAKETVGRSLLDFVNSRELRDKFMSDMLLFHQTGKSNYVNNKFSFVTDTKSGDQVAIEAALRSIKVGGNLLFSVFIRDITPRRSSGKN